MTSIEIENEKIKKEGPTGFFKGDKKEELINSSEENLKGESVMGKFNKITIIKQIGAKRTGTNFARAVFYANYKDTEVWMNAGGWKHAPLDFDICKDDFFAECDEKFRDILLRRGWPTLYKDFQNAKIAVSIKNPYHWFVSYAVFSNIPFPVPEHKIKEILETEWNPLYKSVVPFLQEDGRGQVVVIYYEDLLTNLEEVIRGLAHVWGIELRYKQIATIFEKMAANVDSNPLGVAINTRFEGQNYLTDSFTGFLDADAINAINKYILPETFTVYGYDKYIPG